MNRKIAYIVAALGLLSAVAVIFFKPDDLFLGWGMLCLMIIFINLFIFWPKRILKISAPELSEREVREILQKRDPHFTPASSCLSPSFPVTSEMALKHLAIKRGVDQK